MVQVFAPFLLLLSLSSCHLEVLDPIRNGLIADFDYAFSNQEGDVPINVSFVNGSTEAISYRWDFGDGSVLSTEFNPSHDYTKAGDYTVTLTAINELGEEDFISLPLTLNARRYVKEWPLSGGGLTTFTGAVPVGDTAYLFTGTGELSPPPTLLTDLYGTVYDTSVYRSFFSGETAIIDIPGYYLGDNFSNAISYENGTAFTNSFSQPDLFLIGNYEEFGYPRHVVFETEGEDGGASLIYFGSKRGANSSAPRLMNFFESRFNSPWPITLEQYCSLTGITASPGGGVVCIGFQSGNCAEGLRIEEYNSEGNQLKFKQLSILSRSESWKIVRGNSNRYIAIGNYPDERELLLYIMDDDFNVISQNSVSTEQDFFELKDAKSGGDGTFFVVGETSSSSSTIKAFKINNDGSILWQQAYGFPTKVTNVNGIYPTNDCGLLIYGSYYAGFNPEAPLIIKTDQDGLVE